MATVLKLKLKSGLIRWRADYVDCSGKRRFKQFVRKMDAEAWLVETSHDVARGLHTPASVSPTVKEAGELWLKRCYDKALERMTTKGYEEHCKLHIYPFVGSKKLAELTVPAVNTFADQLRVAGRSAEIIRRVVRSLGAIFREARRRGLANVDPTAGLELDLPERDDPRPAIPTKEELQAIIARATGRWRPLVLVATFCGLRASELRGLRWPDINFDERQIRVAQRADASHKIGRLKSKAAYRSTPLPPMVLNALREWSLVCPKGDLRLVFPNGSGKVESYSNLIERGFDPIQVAAGIVDEAGAAKYGLHALRHACASLWIENGMNPKRIQKLMGHSSIQMTYDVYGHLFADAEGDQKAAEDIQVRLLGK